MLFVDLNELSQQVGRIFRAVPKEVEPIVANLSISNMHYFEFADRADQDGVFRGSKAAPRHDWSRSPAALRAPQAHPH